MRDSEHTIWFLSVEKQGIVLAGFKQDYVSLLQHLLHFCLQNIKNYSLHTASHPWDLFKSKIKEMSNRPVMNADKLVSPHPV
jgi:hypothetical protein